MYYQLDINGLNEQFWRTEDDGDGRCLWMCTVNISIV